MLSEAVTVNPSNYRISSTFSYWKNLVYQIGRKQNHITNRVISCLARERICVSTNVECCRRLVFFCMEGTFSPSKLLDLGLDKDIYAQPLDNGSCTICLTALPIGFSWISASFKTFILMPFASVACPRPVAGLGRIPVL